jgi:CRISPR-associated endonuclease Csy4
MDHYFDVQIRRDPEFAAHDILSALFSKLHRALVTDVTISVGVSFPGYSLKKVTLGDTLRILGSKSDLDHLSGGAWMRAVRDHIELTPTLVVPNGATHRALRRVQAKSSVDRLIRRQARRHGISESAARAKLVGARSEHLTLPFISMSSSSTGQPFRLFLSLGPDELRPQAGAFNAYGLSQSATVAWF